MRILREYVRATLAEEILLEKKIKSIDDVETIGDLKQLIKSITRKKQGKEGGKGLVDTALDIVVDEIGGKIPGFATAKNLFMAAKSMYKLDDEAKVGSLGALNVDDDMSRVIDDSVENAFLKDFLNNLDHMDDNTPLTDLDVTGQLSDWISLSYNDTIVKSGDV